MCPDSEKPDIAEKLALLKEKYFEQLPNKVAEIEVLRGKLNSQSTEQLPVLKELYRHVHGLVGTAGTFGAENLSSVAKQLLQVLSTIIETENKISQDEKDSIERLIAMVKKQSQVKQ